MTDSDSPNRRRSPAAVSIDTSHFHELLLKQRDELLAETRRGAGPEGAPGDPPDLENELSDYPDHPADIGTELFEREKQITLRRNALALLERVDDALLRIKSGTYGICASCGKPIPERRLEVMPSAIYCVECQSMLESRSPR